MREHAGVAAVLAAALALVACGHRDALAPTTSGEATPSLAGTLDPGPFIKWPLRVDDPLTAPVVTVFDHSVANTWYSYDGVLTAANDLVATRQAGIAGKKPPCYRLQDPIANASSLATIMNYVGPRDCPLDGTYLSYDDHPGIDFRYCVGTAVYAPVAGRVTYTFSGPEGNGPKYNALTIEMSNGWRVRFLHLSSYIDSKSAIYRRPAAGCAYLPSKADIPCPTCAQEGDIVRVGRGDPIAYTGDFSKHWGGVSPHLHFEVLDPNGVPRDPYGWHSSATDPRGSFANGPLWLSGPLPVILYSHDEGLPDAVFSGSIGFMAEQDGTVTDAYIYLRYIRSLQDLEWFTLLDNASNDLDCDTVVQSYADFGADASPYGAFVRLRFSGQQCAVTKGHWYSLKTVLNGSGASIGGYAGSRTAYVYVSDGQLSLQP